MKKNLALAAALLVGMLPLAAQSGEKMNVKTGLWEITTQTGMTGTPPIPPDVLAKMTPEQRARMQALSGSDRSHTAQSCVTEKDLEHGLEPQENRQSSCKVVSTNTTGTTQEIHMQCDNDHMKGTSVMKVVALDREHMQADMKMDAVSQGGPMHMTMHMTGKWVSSDCGAVKPGH